MSQDSVGFQILSLSYLQKESKPKPTVFVYFKTRANKIYFTLAAMYEIEFVLGKGSDTMESLSVR